MNPFQYLCSFIHAGALERCQHGYQEDENCVKGKLESGDDVLQGVVIEIMFS